jgi:ribonucleoside-diphosphate reductase subunit M2
MNRELDIIEIAEDRLILPYNNKYIKHVELLDEEYKFFWTQHEIKTPSDEVVTYSTKLGPYKSILQFFLTFFIKADDLIVEALEENYLSTIKVPEIINLYGFQKSMEVIHSKVYLMLINAYIPDEKERAAVYKEAVHNKFIVAKQKFVLKGSVNDIPALKAFKLACAEHLFFTSAFTFIDHLQYVGKPLNSLYQANYSISRDEFLHVQSHAATFLETSIKLDEKDALAILREAVDIESSFLESIFADKKFGDDNLATSNNYIQHLKFCANKLFVDYFQYTTIPYKLAQEDPLSVISTNRKYASKFNFFERQSAEYNATISAEFTTNKLDWSSQDRYYEQKEKILLDTDARVSDVKIAILPDARVSDVKIAILSDARVSDVKISSNDLEVLLDNKSKILPTEHKEASVLRESISSELGSSGKKKTTFDIKKFLGAEPVICKNEDGCVSCGV